MSSTFAAVRILVIRAWTEPLAPLRAALREAGIVARIVRVDIEPALNAALVRGDFDVIVFDQSTRALPRALLDALMQEHHRTTQVIEYGDVDTIVEAVRQVAHRLLN